MFAIDTTMTSNDSTTCLWTGGDGVLYVSGTFGSGTVTLSASPSTGLALHNSFIALGANTTLTANGIAGFTMSTGMTLKVTLSGATNPNLRIVVATKN